MDIRTRLIRDATARPADRRTVNPPIERGTTVLLNIAADRVDDSRGPVYGLGGFAAHRALEDGLGFAVRIDAPGGILRDYHTAQAPKARRNLTWRTRKAELADRDNLGTILSERLYRVEAQATVALWRKAGESDLAALAAALARPHYVLSLGRKSCPLSEPVRALVVSADGLRAAYDAYDSARAADDAIVASHCRMTGSGQTNYDWQHYIDLVQRKPGALRNGAPFLDMPEPSLRLRQSLLRYAGGDRVMADVLAMVPQAGLEAVLVAVSLLLRNLSMTLRHLNDLV